MPLYILNINGHRHEVDVDSDKPLLWILRDELKLTGTKYGCGIGLCGTCTVQVKGRPVRSCSIPISAIGKNKIITIEGLAMDKSNPIFTAWIELNVPQCGFCHSGQIVTADALLKNKSNPSDAEIDDAMSGVLCRCGTYERIRKAIKHVESL